MAYLNEPFKPSETFDIRLALRVMRHISSGIYRDRAGSLRELVSNSFDSQASEVTINTGAPRFETMVVDDNGMGMDAGVVRESFTHVGLSYKQIHPEKFVNDLGRPIIGRFGIGFLAAAHISDDLWIDSFVAESNSGIRVHVNLKPFFLYQDSVTTFDKFEFGKVEIASIPKGEKDHGTRVELRNVRTGQFFKVLTSRGEALVRWPLIGRREPHGGQVIERLVGAIEAKNLLYVDRLSGREQILWHLAMAAPVEYLDPGPIRPGFGDSEANDTVRQLKDRVAGLKFKVWLDGVELRKPILLPTPNRNEEVPDDPMLPERIIVRPITVDGKIEGEQVKALGYLFYQPYRIYPADLRGLLPRLDYVAVGNNRENRFIASLTGENPVIRAQVSGELYIQKGLHRALDLDRSGFMELDPEYLFLVENAGSAVRAFFMRAKNARSQEYRTKQRAAAAAHAEVTAQTVQEWAKTRGTPIRASVSRGILSTPRRSTDPSTTLQVGTDERPILRLDREKRSIELSEDPPDPAIVMLLLGFDDILSKYVPNPAQARRELAALVRSVLESVRRNRAD